MRQHRDRERGATLVEASISYGLLFITLFAIVEFGLAFKDWLSVGHAAREGARAGATYGEDPEADILVLREVQDTLGLTGLPVGTRVTIFRATTAAGTPETDYFYAPGDLSDCDEVDPINNPLPEDCCDWTPCPEPGRPTYEPDCDTFPATCAPRWETSERDVEAPGTDRIGVEIEFTHDWLTGFFMDSSDFTTATDFQLEPEVFAP